jgi:hypothetical protein
MTLQKLTWTTCAVALLLVCLDGAAQDGADTQRIALFTTSYEPGESSEDENTTDDLTVEDPIGFDLDLLDRTVRQILDAFGRFTVSPLPQHLATEDASRLPATLSDFVSHPGPRQVAVSPVGETPLSTSDLEYLSRSYMVVAPALTGFQVTRFVDGYSAMIRFEIIFVDVSDLRIAARLVIDGDSVGSTAEEAIREAMAALSDSMLTQIMMIPELRLRTHVVGLDSRSVELPIGSGVGVQRGDEFAVVTSGVVGERVVTTETGLVTVRDVEGDHSIGIVPYATPRIGPGDVLQRLPRRGMELQFYLRGLTNGLDDINYSVGFRAVPTSGFYEWRPFAAGEIPFRGLLDATVFPINFLFGGEWNAYFGRLRLTPSASVGASVAFPLFREQDVRFVHLSHLGLLFATAGSVLLSRDVMVFVEVGLGVWGTLYRGSNQRLAGPFSNYGGLLLGGGITLK